MVIRYFLPFPLLSNSPYRNDFPPYSVTILAPPPLGIAAKIVVHVVL